VKIQTLFLKLEKIKKETPDDQQSVQIMKAIDSLQKKLFSLLDTEQADDEKILLSITVDLIHLISICRTKSQDLLWDYNPEALVQSAKELKLAQQVLIKILESIYQLTLNDLVIMNDRVSFLRESLSNVVNTIQTSGTDDIALILTALMPKHEHLLSHDVISKFNLIGEYYYTLGSKDHTSMMIAPLAIAVATARKEFLLMPDKEQINADYVEQAQHEKTLKDSINEQHQQKIHALNTACLTYMRHLKSNIATNIRKNPHLFTKYLAIDDETALNIEDLSSEYHISRVISDTDIPERTRLGVEKYNAIRNGLLIINNKNMDARTRLERFETYYKKIKPLIEIRRDTAGTLFIKVITSILTLGIAIPFIWSVEGESLSKEIHRFFSPKEEENNNNDISKLKITIQTEVYRIVDEQTLFKLQINLKIPYKHSNILENVLDAKDAITTALIKEYQHQEIEDINISNALNGNERLKTALAALRKETHTPKHQR